MARAARLTAARPRVRRDRRDRRDREAELYAAALRLFSRHGYHGTSMRDIGESVGLLKGSLYHYVPSKEALLVRLFAGALEATVAEIEAIGSDGAPPADRLERMARAYVLANLRNLEAVRMYQREWRALPPSALAALRRRRAALRRLFADVVGEGMRAGAFTRGEARIAALAVMGLCGGVQDWYRREGRLSAEAIADALAARAVRSLR